MITRLAIIYYLISYCSAFYSPVKPNLVKSLRLAKSNVDLKEELAKYLEKREELAEEVAKLYVP